eukprot:849499-Rhodomonas_salina.2
MQCLALEDSILLLRLSQASWESLFRTMRGKGRGNAIHVAQLQPAAASRSQLNFRAEVVKAREL